jgi:hypothetical protein
MNIIKNLYLLKNKNDLPEWNSRLDKLVYITKDSLDFVNIFF